MSEAQVHPLPDEAMTICPRCRFPVWVFKTPDGTSIALDAVAGGYLTTPNGIAYQTTDQEIGYRDHQRSCERLARAPLSEAVTSSEFLWR